METLTHFTYCWEWEVQYRVIKPKKQKKIWVDYTIGFLANDADECRRVVLRRCEERGWTLVEIYLMKPTVLAFCIDNEMPDDYLMPRAERYQVCPRPATYGAEWSEQTAAQIKRARKEEKQKQAIRAAFPLLAEQLIATEFPKN